MYGPISAQQALNMDNAEVLLKTNLEAAIDAKGVFTSIENGDTKVPAESSLLSAVQAVREALEEKRLRTLYWVDTRDMVSDGLTKGAVDRAELIRLYEKNVWQTIGDKPVSVSLAVSGGKPSRTLSGTGSMWISGTNWSVCTDWCSLVIQ